MANSPESPTPIPTPTNPKPPSPPPQTPTLQPRPLTQGMARPGYRFACRSAGMGGPLHDTSFCTSQRGGQVRGVGKSEGKGCGQRHSQRGGQRVWAEAQSEGWARGVGRGTIRGGKGVGEGGQMQRGRGKVKGGGGGGQKGGGGGPEGGERLGGWVHIHHADTDHAHLPCTPMQHSSDACQVTHTAHPHTRGATHLVVAEHDGVRGGWGQDDEERAIC